jgi:hypothetical protein
MPTPLHSLTITELNEISFVDKGDNPPAGVLIVKSAPSTPGASVDPEAIQKQIDDAVTKAKADAAVEKAALEARISKMEEAEAVAKVEGFVKSAHLPDELVGPLRAVQKSAPAADFAKVQAELSRLGVALFKAQTELGQRIGGVGKVAGSAEAQMEAKAAEIMKRDGCDKATAYTKLLNEAPEIYKAYTAQQEA